MIDSTSTGSLPGVVPRCSGYDFVKMPKYITYNRCPTEGRHVPVYVYVEIEWKNKMYYLCILFWVFICWFVPDIEYLRLTLPGSIEEEFFMFLKQLNASDVCLYAVDEGCVVFPRYEVCVLYNMLVPHWIRY